MINNHGLIILFLFLHIFGLIHNKIKENEFFGGYLLFSEYDIARGQF